MCVGSPPTIIPPPPPAPPLLETPSGQVVRHRLSRAGDRKLNHALYMMAMVQVRRPSAGQAYYRRKLAEGMSPKEALRCLKRRLSDAVHRCLVADQRLASLPVDPGRQPSAAPPRGHHLLTFRQEGLTAPRASRYLDDMDLGERQAATLATASTSPDPEVGLRAVAALRGLLEVLEALQVDNARANGWSWQQIASRLGVTKQAVHQKHGPPSRPMRGR
jgi:hypothetical protein